MSRAFLVSGYMSSGNRAVAGILVAAGCAGKASTEQPQYLGQLEAGHDNYVVIRHDRVALWADELAGLGYEVAVLILIREPHATACSAANVGHDRSYGEARRRRLSYLHATLRDCEEWGIRHEVFTYESLESTGARESLLRWCGLPEEAAQASLTLPGQIAPESFQCANEKHYRRLEAGA